MPKIYISDKGDLSNNIFPFEAILDFNVQVDDDKRNEFRIGLIEFLQKFFTLKIPIDITFDDECRRCGARLEKRKNGRFKKCQCFKTKKKETKL